MKYEHLLALVQETHRVAQIRAITVTDQSLLIRNWLLGFWIVEFEQNGEDRATYGAKLFQRLSVDLQAGNIPGCSVVTLRRMRTFYLQYPQVSEVFSVAGAPLQILKGIQKELPNPILYNGLQIRSVALTKFKSDKVTSPVPELTGQQVIQISWSKIQELLRLEDPLKRAFYENGCILENWNLSNLQRHINSLLYERTGLSIDKEVVLRNARIALSDPEKSNTQSILDIIRDPYILEFSGLKTETAYLESELEKALLDHLQGFLLELGSGFCFEARQKRISLEDEDDWIDLVFYNRLLRCHVLIDLKVREFRHSDAGQMNFYLNWWKDHGMGEGDQPPVGLILCTEKKSARVQYATAGMDQSLFVSRYMVQLPKPEDLQGFLERDRAFLEQKMETSI